MKSRRHLPFSKFKKEMLKDPEIKAAYDALEPEYAVIRAILEARMKKGLTQKELARKVGTKQSAISRIETGVGNPSLQFLKKLAAALDAKLQIRFVSQ